MTDTVPVVEQGLYEHYKGNHYRVIGMAAHTETGESLVVYVAVKEPDRLWVRPAAMFAEKIEFNGERRPRFRLLEKGA